MAIGVTLPKVGLAVLGVAGASGVGVLIKSQLSKEPEKMKFKDRYKKALFDLKATQGDGFTKVETKWNDIKGSLNPKNEFLKKAKELLSSSKEEEAKKAYRKGCQSIYDSEFSDKGELWSDFKTYCSITNQESFTGGTWVTEAISGSSVGTVWTNKLNALKGKASVSLQKLLNLKGGLGTSTYSVEQANKLKSWCDEEKVNPFEGDHVDTYRYLEEFCRGT